MSDALEQSFVKQLKQNQNIIHKICRLYTSGDDAPEPVKPRKVSKLPHFVGVYTLIYLVNVVALGVMLQFGIPEWLGGLILLLPSAILSYVLTRQFVFPP